jgi:hypothetical protein
VDAGRLGFALKLALGEFFRTIGYHKIWGTVAAHEFRKGEMRLAFGFHWINRGSLQIVAIYLSTVVVPRGLD